MTVDYLVNLLKSRDFLGGMSIDTGYLSEKDNSVSVEPDGSDEVVRNYCDGGKIKAFGFSLVIRLKKGLGDNAENLKITERISDYLVSLNDFLQCGGEIPLLIEVTKGPVLAEDNIHSLKYRTECRLLYLKEEKNNG